MTAAVTRSASAHTLKVGDAVLAVRAAPSFGLHRATVVDVTVPATIHHGSPSVTVRFDDNSEQSYHGAAIRDYILEERAA